jgi:metal-responsive CopG/Arc/MetJ family transcriptional regulator
MPNWCFASYVIEGDKKEIDELEQMMNRLRNMEKPAVDNGFGTDWLGCIVH